ncbi:MAG: phosphate ABC transporter permease subunit PstC [Clostridia bacterium]|nr:phosphate ABC transporter permease subunit PstC [Clostridia bacterium]
MTKIKEAMMRAVFALLASVSALCVVLICVFLFANGIPAMTKIGVPDFLLGTTWRPGNDIYGIFPMILASIYVSAGAMIIGVPLGILCAVYLAYFCPKKVYRVLKPMTELLSGVPSIVYGFFALVVLVPAMRVLFGAGKSLLTACILLGIMILPTIISVTESALLAAPKTYYEGALALGASHEQSVFRAVLPAAKSGISAAIMLGIGRAIGETTAVAMVVGNQPVVPGSLLQGARTLTTNIVLEMGYAAGLHREALIATAVVLFVLVLLINLSFSLFKRRDQA